MPQLGWTVFTHQGQRYQLGLFHGDNTGHVVVHCNLRVMLIDFNVRDSKTYSFFLDQDLCELKIERVPDGFRYNCQVNQDVDTPQNRKHKENQEKEKRHWRQSLWLGGVFFGAALLFSALLLLINRPNADALRAELLAGQGENTSIRLRHETSDQYWHYSYRAGSRVVTGLLSLEDTLTAYGLPIRSGDEFIARYAEQRPDIYRIDYDQPTLVQLERFKERAAEIHARAHPELSRRQVRCQVDAAYEQAGLGGLGDLYQQTTAPTDHARHNRESYQRLVRSTAFQQAVKECL